MSVKRNYQKAINIFVVTVVALFIVITIYLVLAYFL